jgi:hypothetical protein
MSLFATVVPWIIALLTLSWGIFSYGHHQRSLLALERTKFIFEHLRFFETDQSMQMANKIVCGLATDFTIETFLDVMKSNKGTPEEVSKCMAVDNYLNFVWRVAYAHLILKTISIDDLDAFGYYF